MGAATAFAVNPQRYDRCAGFEGKAGRRGCGGGKLSEELTDDTLVRKHMLIDNKDNDLSTLERCAYVVLRASACDQFKAGTLPSSKDKTMGRRPMDRFDDGIDRHPSDRLRASGQVVVSHVSGHDDHPFAALQCLFQDVPVPALDQHFALSLCQGGQTKDFNSKHAKIFKTTSHDAALGAPGQFSSEDSCDVSPCNLSPNWENIVPEETDGSADPQRPRERQRLEKRTDSL